MYTYRIIYPCGDRNKLSVAQVHENEVSDWSLASRKDFPDTDEGFTEAAAYAKHLGQLHGLEVEINSTTFYLD